MKKALHGGWAICSRLIAAAMVFLIAAGLLWPIEAYSASSSKAELELEAKGGFDGVARLGAYTPYRITLVNKGRAVEGEVQLEMKIDSENKAVFAKPFSLPEGSAKEIAINAPVYTARRGVHVRVLENKKTIKEMDYTFARLIPPDYKTIGVLSSDNPAYGYLNGIEFTQPLEGGADDEKLRVMRASGAYVSSAVSVSEDRLPEKDTEGVLIPLTAEEMPGDIKTLESFDVLVVSNFDTSSLTAEQTGALESWVENGGTLILGMGVNWEKTYNSLPAALKKFSVMGVKSAPPPVKLSDFSGAGFSGGLKLDMATGDIGFDYVPEQKEAEAAAGEAELNGKGPVMIPGLHKNDILVGNEAEPVVVKYVHKEGRILFLAFDPGMEPFAGWDGKEAFFGKLLYHSTENNRFQERGSGYFSSNYNNQYYTENLTSQVPEDKKPPFLFMFVTIAVYIAIVGPIMYMFLKKKDRRDLSWLAIPAAALACLLLIYVVGFRTRYSTAVLNTASIINLDTVNQKTDITTGMGIFNNKRGDLKLTYSKDSNIDFDITRNAYNYNSYPAGKEPEGRVVGKLVLSEPFEYELYDVAMWEPRNVEARKTLPMDGSLLQSVHIKDGKFKAVIKNITQYEFNDVFLSVGLNFIGVGDILPGQEKPVEADFNSKDVYKDLQNYLDAKYGRAGYGTKPPPGYFENMRKRNAVETLVGNQYLNIRGELKVGLYALNYQDMGYDLMINGKKPQTYNTNAVFSSGDMRFEKGGEVEIPSGIIIPELIQDYGIEQSVRMDGDSGIRVMREGDIDFTFSIPSGIQVAEFSLRFGTYLPLGVKYAIEDMKQQGNNAGAKILQNQYEYYIYNRATDSWEKVPDTYEQLKDVGRYIDGKNTIKARVRVVKLADEKAEENYDGSYVETERLAFPGLQIKGVAR